nr:MAG: hypothetical protein DIU70_04005 [Bacillota bacterium]
MKRPPVRAFPSGRHGGGSVDLALAILRRGFIAFPRLLIDWANALDLGYDDLGKLLVLLNEPELQAQDPLGADYCIRAEGNPDRYRKMRERLMEFADLGLVFYRDDPDRLELTFNFRPLVDKLNQLLQQQEAVAEEAAAATTPDEPPATSFLDQMERHKPLLRYAEQRLNRPLSDREVRDIIDWIYTYGFDDRVVRAILDEGVERGITRFSYLNQIARQWHEKGIRTLEDAEAAEARHQQLMVRWGRVIARLGQQSRRLTPAEQEKLEKWTKEWNFPEEVILRACDEAILNGRPTFAYVDGILQRWLQEGVRTLADAERLLEERRRAREAASRSGSRSTAARPRSNVVRPVPRKDDAYYEQFIWKPKR